MPLDLRWPGARLTAAFKEISYCCDSPPLDLAYTDKSALLIIRALQREGGRIAYKFIPNSSQPRAIRRREGARPYVLNANRPHPRFVQLTAFRRCPISGSAVKHSRPLLPAEYIEAR